MRRLKSRQRMLVDQLDLPAALKHEAELVKARDASLKHHAIDEEQGHPFRLAAPEMVRQLRTITGVTIELPG